MNQIKQWLINIIIVTLPIMSIINFFGRFEFNVALSDLFILLLGIIYLIDIRAFKLKDQFPYWWYFFSLIIVVTISDIYAMYFSTIKSGSIILIISESLKIIITALYFFVGYTSISNKKLLKTSINCWIVGLWIFILVGLYTTVSTWMGVEVIKWHNTIGSDNRFLGTLTDANAAALYLSISFFLVLFSYHSLINKMIEKILYVITMVFTVICMFFTFSRGGLIGFSIGFAFYLLFNIKRLYKKLLYIIPLLIVFSLLLINIDTNCFNNYFYNTFVGRSKDVLERTGMFETRKLLSLSALHMGLDHPILGVGRGHFPFNSKPYLIFEGVDWNSQGEFYKDLIPHNTVLGIFAEIGIVGLIIFLSIFILMFYKINKAKRISTNIKLLLYCLWVSIFVQSLAINLENTRGLWILVGILFAVLDYELDIKDNLHHTFLSRWSKRNVGIFVISSILYAVISYTLFIDTAVKLKGEGVDFSNRVNVLFYRPNEKGKHTLRYYLDTKNVTQEGTLMRLNIYSKDLERKLLNSVQYNEVKGYGNLEFIVNKNTDEIQVELVGQDSTIVKDIKVITPSNKVIPILNDYLWLSDSMFYKYQEKNRLVDEETLKNKKEKRKFFKQGILSPDEQIVLGDKILYKGATITKLGENTVRFDFTFECLDKMERDYIFWMHIHVDDINTIPKEGLKNGYINADHDLEIPTTSWEPGKTYVHTYVRELLPGEYNANFGFWLWEQTASKGKIHRLVTEDGKDGINLGWFSIDIGN